MMSAFMNLSADTCKGCSTYTILTVIVMYGQIASSGLIVNFLDAITGDTPYRICPIFFVFVADIESGLAPIDLCKILYPLKTGIGLEG